MSRRLLVFCWHNVDPTPAFPARAGSGRRGFTRQISMLARIAHVVPLAGALETLRRGEQLPRRAVSLTFDDGYRDNLEVAVPILDRYDVPATFFLTPGFLDGENAPWWESLATAFRHRRRDTIVLGGRSEHLDGACVPSTVLDRLKSLSAEERQEEVRDLRHQLDPHGPQTSSDLLLDWTGAESLVRRGFGIGAHSMTHPILARESSATQLQEIADSRARLRARLDQPIDLFAYPNGRSSDYDERSIAAVTAAGFESALTTIAGWNGAHTPPYELRRVVVTPERGMSGLLQEARWWLSARIRRSAA